MLSDIEKQKFEEIQWRTTTTTYHLTNLRNPIYLSFIFYLSLSPSFFFFILPFTIFSSSYHPFIILFSTISFNFCTSISSLPLSHLQYRIQPYVLYNAIDPQVKNLLSIFEEKRMRVSKQTKGREYYERKIA
jgi:hypothetical protein